MRYSWVIPICIVFFVGLIACQSTSPTTVVPESTELQTPGLVPESPQTQIEPPVLTPKDITMVSPITPDAAAQKMVDLAKKHLAQRLGISVDQITLLEAKPVVWRDASLGCPQPAIDYMRVETPGYNIALEAGGKTYNVHTDKANRAVMCNRP